jgi:tRNA (cmo5U34)-methyltransferase
MTRTSTRTLQETNRGAKANGRWRAAARIDAPMTVGDGLQAGSAQWSFKGAVAQNFDEHVQRSVPFYDVGHELVCELSDFFVKHDSRCYEIGSSTGSLTLKLAAHNRAKPNARFIGVEIEPDMVKMAEAKKAAARATNVEFVREDALQTEFDTPDLMVAYYTVQFIRPSQRQALIDRIYRSLNWGGAFLLFEKVRANDARYQDITTALYHDFKLRRGFSAEEIVGKARSLKGILEPFSTQGNTDMLRRAGFVDIISIVKYVCFEGFLAIK